MGLKRVESSAASFLGELCAPKEGTTARYGVLQVPYDLTTSYVSGARKGPEAIVEASGYLELYDDELECEPCDAGIVTFEPLEALTTGPEDMIEAVRLAATQVIGRGMLPVMLGGEHSVTLGLAKALKEKYENLSVLQLDAHADMRDTYQKSPFNHACVARRISEIAPLTQVGIRSLSIEEAEFLKPSEKPFDVSTFHARDAVGAMDCDAITDTLTHDDLFITIDLDVFDPSVMPATGTPEPGGLGWYQVIDLLRNVSKRKNIVGFDVVELSPIQGMVAPDFLTAKLVYKLMSFINNSVD